jgi:predicted transcriptional regulator
LGVRGAQKLLPQKRLRIIKPLSVAQIRRINKKLINDICFCHSVIGENRMASNVVVKDIMQKDVKVVNNNTVMQEVVAIMNKFDKDAILVVQSGKPTGIITVKDVLIRAVEANHHCKNGLHKPTGNNR